MPYTYRDFSYADMLDTLRRRLPHLEHVLVLDTTREQPAGLAPFAAAMAGQSAAFGCRSAAG